MPIYDVENRFSYYKSYSDNILVGPPKPKMGDTTWLRAVSGSVVSGSEEWKAATVLSDYDYKKANQFYKSGEVRYLRIASATQAIKDTITPNILELFLTGTANTSGSLVYSKDVETQLNFGGPFFKLYFSIDGQPVTESVTGNNNRFNNVDWTYSFPYEKKYFNVASFANVNQPYTARFYDDFFAGNESYYVGSQNKTDVLNYDIFVIGLTRSGSTLGFGNTEGALLDLYFDSTGSYNGSAFTIGETKSGSFINPTLAPKLIFGINPQPLGRITAPYGDSSATYRYSGSYCTGSVIEGWKYGLYNGVPTNFSCVFRQNHYGQPRDMLEGRPYTKTYNNKEIGGPMDTDGGINFISGSALSGESNNYLTASIYQSTNVTAAYTVNPYGSGIFDKEYRASQPWHDDDPRVGT